MSTQSKVANLTRQDKDDARYNRKYGIGRLAMELRYSDPGLLTSEAVTEATKLYDKGTRANPLAITFNLR